MHTLMNAFGTWTFEHANIPASYWMKYGIEFLIQDEIEYRTRNPYSDYI